MELESTFSHLIEKLCDLSLTGAIPEHITQQYATHFTIHSYKIKHTISRFHQPARQTIGRSVNYRSANYLTRYMASGHIIEATGYMASAELNLNM